MLKYYALMNNITLYIIKRRSVSVLAFHLCFRFVLRVGNNYRKEMSSTKSFMFSKNDPKKSTLICWRIKKKKQLEFRICGADYNQLLKYVSSNFHTSLLKTVVNL